ncbi:MAG: aminodeoxychorismate/anthranilate synthase component II [Clostridiales bacterium]|nr:aminodeoxychorismate/anthranilate synthase component II [Clostridiales bacterium]
MILIIDNYDSFTYNLYQYIAEIIQDREVIEVYRNDRITIPEISEKQPSCIIISPGPGFPSTAGISKNVIRTSGCGESPVPILGVCLGHQAIGEVFGGRVIHGAKPVHGKTSTIQLDTSCPLFYGLPEKITAGRYHSLIVERETLPECLEITAQTQHSEIMGIRHKEYPLFGIQFHPESILTPDGKTILANFLQYTGGCKK